MILYNLQYITNTEGKQNSVVIPMVEWQKLQAEYEFLKKEHSYYQLLIRQLPQISESEMCQRALLSESQITNHCYSSLEALETEASNW